MAASIFKIKSSGSGKHLFGHAPAVPGLKEGLQRKTPPALPDISERDLVKHFVNLERENFGVDYGFYPLGSCTMKYNPAVNERIASSPAWKNIHPLSDESAIQGVLQVVYELKELLARITGMDDGTLQPLAGAHGELTGLMMIKKYFEDRGEDRREIIIPDTAHGTNPASAAAAGFCIRKVNTGPGGFVTSEIIAAVLGRNTAAVMLTNPNTLGIFEREAAVISAMAHKNGSLMYCDGANMNALMGIALPGKIGFDCMHINLHKTFSTPHGGGGPGAGPVLVRQMLAPYLPGEELRHDNGRYFTVKRDKSIGSVSPFHGNFLVLLRAFAYIKSLGFPGLKDASVNALINANYLKKKLSEIFSIPYSNGCLHEFVISMEEYREKGVSVLDIAKRLMDYGIHPPTVYFPLIVKEALMIEPTETESKETLDRFIEVMKSIAGEIKDEPALLKKAPLSRPGGRFDEVKAARELVVREDLR